MLVRAIFAAVLHILTSLNATYNHLIFSASVFKTLDAATEHGPKLNALVGRAVEHSFLKLPGSPRISAISPNYSNTANDYSDNLVFVFVSDATSPTSATATIATVNKDVCYLPSITDALSFALSEPVALGFALSSDDKDDVVGEPDAASGELMLYSEEYALQQKGPMFCWTDLMNLDWDLLVSLVLASMALSKLGAARKAREITSKKIEKNDSLVELAPASESARTSSSPAQTQLSSPSTPTPPTYRASKFTGSRCRPPRPRAKPPTIVPEEYIERFDDSKLTAATSPYSTNNVSESSSTASLLSTESKGASAADLAERLPLSGSEDCVEAPIINGTAPSPNSINNVNTPSAVVDALTADQDKSQHPSDCLEASDIPVVALSPNSTNNLNAPADASEADLVEPLLPSDNADASGAPNSDDEALSAAQGAESLHPRSAESTNSDRRVEEGDSQVEMPACAALDSDIAVEVTTQPTAVLEGSYPSGTTIDLPTTDNNEDAGVTAIEQDSGEEEEFDFAIEKTKIAVFEAAEDAAKVARGRTSASRAALKKPVMVSFDASVDGPLPDDTDEPADVGKLAVDQDLSDEEDDFDYEKEAARLALEREQSQLATSSVENGTAEDVPNTPAMATETETDISPVASPETPSTPLPETSSWDSMHAPKGRACDEYLVRQAAARDGPEVSVPTSSEPLGTIGTGSITTQTSTTAPSSEDVRPSIFSRAYDAWAARHAPYGPSAGITQQHLHGEGERANVSSVASPETPYTPLLETSSWNSVHAPHNRERNEHVARQGAACNGSVQRTPATSSNPFDSIGSGGMHDSIHAPRNRGCTQRGNHTQRTSSKPALLDRIGPAAPIFPQKSIKPTASQPVAGPSRYPPTPPPTPPKLPGGLKSSCEKMEAERQRQIKRQLKHKAVSIQALRLFAARDRLAQRQIGNGQRCGACTFELPNKCKCNLAKFAPAIENVERFLEATGYPPDNLELLAHSGCTEAERWLQQKAEEYSDEAAWRLPRVRESLRVELARTNRYREVRYLLSHTLLPVYLFFMFQPGEVTPPNDVIRAESDKVLVGDKVTGGWGHTSIFTIYSLLKFRTAGEWGGDRRNAHANRRR